LNVDGRMGAREERNGGNRTRTGSWISPTGGGEKKKSLTREENDKKRTT